MERRIIKKAARMRETGKMYNWLLQFFISKDVYSAGRIKSVICI